MKLRIIFFTFFLLSCNQPDVNYYRSNINVNTERKLNTESKLKTIGCRVVGIKDGDTFLVLIDGNEQVIRLEHIDCPEKKQPFGKNAKQFASDLCFEQFVQLKHKNKFDRNKRLIAEVILFNGTNVNKELVNNGLAWHFKKYSDDEDYAELEISARNNQVGIWSDHNPTAPWDWRKK